MQGQVASAGDRSAHARMLASANVHGHGQRRFFLCDSYSGGRRRAGCGLPALPGATVQSMPQDGTVEQTMVAQRPQNLEDVEEAVQGTPQERVDNRKVKQDVPMPPGEEQTVNKQQQQRQQDNLERLLFWTLLHVDLVLLDIFMSASGRTVKPTSACITWHCFSNQGGGCSCVPFMVHVCGTRSFDNSCLSRF